MGDPRYLTDELAELLTRQDSIVSLGQATRYLSRAAVRHLVSSGRWRRVQRGVMCAHTGPVSDEQRLWIAALAIGGDEPALLGGPTALSRLGMQGLTTSEWVHVLLPARSRERGAPPGVVVHRSSTLPPGDVVLLGQPPMTSAARSTVDAASWAHTDREAISLVTMAFAQRMVTLEEIRDVLNRMPRVKRRQLIWVVAADAAGGAEPVDELDLTALLRRNGLPLPDRQAVRLDTSGRRRYLDVSFMDSPVRVEIDAAHQLDPELAWAEADEQNRRTGVAEYALRFPAWVVRDRPDKVAADIRRALIAAGWRP